MKKNHGIPEEDRQWLLENPLPDTPGLFSKSPIWFKHSAYEIKEMNNLYICPTIGSKLTTYKPFEKYSEIMADFMTLLLNLDRLPKEFRSIKLIQKHERDYADLILEFTCKYGPLGMMYEYIERLDPCRIKNGEENYDKLIVVLDRAVYRSFPTTLQNKLLPSYTKEGVFNYTPIMKYDDLCSYFLPNEKAPYPEIRSSEFRKGYSEMVNGIMLNREISSLTSHIKKMKEFHLSGNGPSDKSPYLNNMKWNNYLNETISDIGLTFGYNEESNKWDLSWNFKSLIGALSIMYIMNITGKMGSSVNICKYSKCDRIVTDRNCCCIKHDNAYRKAKERAKKGREKQCD